MIMPYVQRRNGAIAGLFENKQPGIAEEWMDGSHSEVLAFISRVNQRPDWEAFFEAKMPLLIQVLITAEAAGAEAKQYVDFLKIEFSKRPDINLPRLRSYWNAAIAPVLTSSQVEELNLAAADYYLPFQINVQGEVF